jgi:hypothetical protein
MKNKKTPIANFNKIPNHNLFVEYFRQMLEKYPNFWPRVEYCERRYSGKLYECLRFFIVDEDLIEHQFIMYADLKPKNGIIKCTLDYYANSHEFQAGVDFDESADVKKMNIRNVILSVCDILEDYHVPLTVKALLEDMEKQNG